jgi:hypothetical protein
MILAGAFPLLSLLKPISRELAEEEHPLISRGIAKKSTASCQHVHPGNRGQRYRQTTIVAIEAKDGKILHRLKCGHDYETEPTFGTAEQLAQALQDQVGKRQRCHRCAQERSLL